MHTLTVVLSIATSLLLLPHPPDSIDLSVVKEEQRLVGGGSRVHLSTERSVNGAVRAAFSGSSEVSPVLGVVYELVDVLLADGGNHHLVGLGLGDFGHAAEEAVAATFENPGFVFEVVGSEFVEAAGVDTLASAAGSGFLGYIPGSVTAEVLVGHERGAQKALGGILCPVPVCSGTLVTTLSEGLLVDDAEVSVPRKERSGSVN